MMKMKENERVVLNTPIPDNRLEPGDVGTIVHVHDNGRAYEVEFVSLDGGTSLIVTASAEKLRAVRKLETPHARLLT